MFWPRYLVEILFPEHCQVCGRLLPLSSQHGICLPCEIRLPPRLELQHHPLYQLFFSSRELEQGFALFPYQKGSSVQRLLHALKYKSCPEAGKLLGRKLGLLILERCSQLPELIVPVPIHPARLRERGYNQCDMIAEGLSAVTGIPVNPRVIKRVGFRDSQTRKSREERFRNMSSAFGLHHRAPDLDRKRLLLLDDVVTTGATLEACVRLLLRNYSCIISVASVSLA